MGSEITRLRKTCTQGMFMEWRRAKPVKVEAYMSHEGRLDRLDDGFACGIFLHDASVDEFLALDERRRNR